MAERILRTYAAIKMLCTFLMHKKTSLSTDCGNLLQQPVSLTFDSQSQNNVGYGNR